MTPRPPSFRAVPRPVSNRGLAGHEPYDDRTLVPPTRPSVESLAAWYSHTGANHLPRKAKGDAVQLSEGDWSRIARLRPTHTLAQLSEMFGPHPSTIAAGLAARGCAGADLRRKETA